MAELIHLLLATVVLRPYVFIFLAFYLTAAVAIGRRRTVLFTVIAWIAFARDRRRGAAYSFVGRRVLL